MAGSRNVNENNALDDKKHKQNLIQLRSVFLRAHAALEADVRKVDELYLQVLEFKCKVVMQKEQLENLKTSVFNLSQKLVTVDRKVLAMHFPESKNISAELELVHQNLMKSRAHIHNAIVEADKVADMLSEGRKNADQVLKKFKQAGWLTKIGLLSEDTLVDLLKGKQNLMDSLYRSALCESSAISKLLKTANFDQAKTESGKAAKAFDHCKQVPIMERFDELNDFVEAHTNMFDVYNQLVNTLEMLTHEYSAKAKSRCYGQATQRNVSINILATLVNHQAAHVNQDPKRCLENLVVALRQQMDETQTSHLKGHWWSFFTTSALSECYGKVLKTLPANLQNITRAIPFPQPQLGYVAV